MELSISLKNNIKNKFFQFIILVLIISIVKDPAVSLDSAKNGLYLWFNVLVPSLLPFFILSELFISSGLVKYFGKLLETIMKPIFNIPGEGSFPFVMSLVSGYPVGAKLTSRLRGLNFISKEEGDRLITLASTSGPLFILGSVLIGMLALPDLTGLMIIPHYLGVITVGIIFSHMPSKSKAISEKQLYPNQSIGNNDSNGSIPVIISNSVRDSINSILMIGGFVIIYNVIIDILLTSQLFNLLILNLCKALDTDPELLKGILAGFIELTTGCDKISRLNIEIITKILSINFLIGWGGLSILSQAISFISQTDISIKKYILSKFLHGITSTIYTYILYLTYYKDYLIPSSLDNIIREEIYSLKNWLDNIYFSAKLSLGICVFFVLLSIFVHNVWLLKKQNN
ncbi:MAG: sporulation integral membrane protein YlbJ [Tissierellaceae bacterium]|nr:sporulation integral membrane protein YlbJ [Tissierellaceae bacterium]